MKQQKSDANEAGVQNSNNSREQLAPRLTSNPVDLVCFSHLGWNFVFQRPQQLLSRGAGQRRVFYIEEPEVDAGLTHMAVSADPSGVIVAIPHLNKALSKVEGRIAHRSLIDRFLVEQGVQEFIAWYYTPMAIEYTDHLKPTLVVYDCMDELSAFHGASTRMRGCETRLLERADLVFTGGWSLYEAKRNLHSNVYAFPSSIDIQHFSQARLTQPDPPDQATIPHPRLGFFGVIDERMDLELLQAVAEARPDWHLVLIGPIAKVNHQDLPRRPNIHYLGKKDYKSLPAYLAGWDAAMLPFAINQATRYISPTKTPEYLAGGRPVISTPITDVIHGYGKPGLVSIASNAAEFVASAEQSLAMSAGERQAWLERVDESLSQNSWNTTWENMMGLVDASLSAKAFNQGAINIDSDSPVLASEAFHLPELPLTSHHNGHNGGTSARVFDYLIVGAGYAGAVLAERLASGSGKKVLLVDRRPHVGGNAYDYYNKDGILIHKYGPHIFHTNSYEVYAYLSRFTEWRPYEHRVRASVDGQLLPLPINLDTVNQMYGLNLNSFELEKFFESVAENVGKVRTSEDVVVSRVGRQLYEKFFRNYTRKQWGLDPSELDASVTSRVPVRNNRDDRYFTDVYQAMPLHGYTRMFENMLDHPNIRLMLNTDYRDIAGYVSYREMIYTGAVDEFFDYRFGKLPYRSLHFKFETLNEEQHQPVAVVNFPNEHPYTRVTEFKHLTGQEHQKTTLVYEYPCSEGDPYYPIPRPENAELYKKYKELADATPGVHFCGRLATYRYYNMDQVTAQALTTYARLAGLPRNASALASANDLSDSNLSADPPCMLVMNGE